MKRILNNRINLLFVSITGILIILIAYLKNDIAIQNYINNGMQSNKSIAFQINKKIEPEERRKLTDCLKNGQLLLFPLDSRTMGVYTKNYSIPLIQAGRSFTDKDFERGSYSVIIGANAHKEFGSSVGAKLSILGADWNVIGVLSYDYETALDDMILLNYTGFSAEFPLGGKIILDGTTNLQDTFQQICTTFPGTQIIETGQYNKTAYQNNINTIFIFVVITSIVISILLSYNWYIIQKNILNITLILGFSKRQSLRTLLFPYCWNTLIGILPAFILAGICTGGNNIVSSIAFILFYFLGYFMINIGWISGLYYIHFCRGKQ